MGPQTYRVFYLRRAWGLDLPGKRKINDSQCSAGLFNFAGAVHTTIFVYAIQRHMCIFEN